MRFRRPFGYAAIALAVVVGLVLAITAPAPLSVDVEKVPSSIAERPENDQSVTPELPAFYDVDVDQLAPAPPGTLIRAEKIEGGPADVEAYRIMYHSRDLQGQDIPVTGFYAYPSGKAPAEGLPLVSYSHGTTGIGRACGMGQAPFTPHTPSYEHFHDQIQFMIAEGWAVVASDFSGMGAPGPASYLVGPLEAQNVLDSMRAVISADASIGGATIDTAKLGTYGKSQGGSAALSTLQAAPSYAPELELQGGMALADGLLVAIPGVLEIVASNPTSTSQNMFMLLIAASYADNYPDLVKIEDVLTPAGIERLELLEKYCSRDLSKRVSDIPLSEMLKTPIDPGLIQAVQQAMPGATQLEQPVVMVQGLKDVTVLPEFTNGLAMSMCALGDTLQYNTYPDDDHPSIPYQARLSEPYIYEWMNDRFAGETAPNNCANKVW